MIDKDTCQRMQARIAYLVTLDPEQDTPEGRELLALCEDVAAYEKENFPFDAPTADALAEFRRAEAGK